MVLLVMVVVFLIVLLAQIFESGQSRAQAYEEALFQSHLRETIRTGQDVYVRSLQNRVINSLMEGDDDNG
jgi:ABC-type bacteriocin/lantibiotic exporter with double-glycine peptidase domain